MGLVLTGSVSAGIPQPLHTTVKKKRFRAKKVFLQHWSNSVEYETVSHQTKILRQKLNRLRNDYDSIIVFPDNRVASSFFNRFTSEADNIGLTLFVPETQTFVLPEQVPPVRFLDVSAEEIIEAKNVKGTATRQAEGILFAISGEQRLILFDSSRCYWTVFVCHDDCATISSSTEIRSSRLVMARFLDQLLTDRLLQNSIASNNTFF
jgi:hypothetical protein